MHLGLDIGTNSIGWWIYKTDNQGAVIGHIDGGVRLFGDGRNPKSGESLAVARRSARQARKRRDRYLRRRSDLIKSLSAAGLMPNDPAARKYLEALDPYSLRAIGLHERLEMKDLFDSVLPKYKSALVRQGEKIGIKLLQFCPYFLSNLNLIV